MPACITETGEHEFMPPIVVEASGFPFGPRKQAAVAICRACGATVTQGWNLEG